MLELCFMKADRNTKKSCKEIQSLIPRYLAEELTVHEAREFTAHLRKCRDCREEIEISYLLGKGLDRVEKGESIDLHTDIDKMLGDTEEAVTRLTQFRTAVYLVESTAVFVLVACMLILYLF